MTTTVQAETTNASATSSWSAYHKISGVKKRVRAFLDITDSTLSDEVLTKTVQCGIECNSTFNSKVVSCELSATGNASVTGTGKITKEGTEKVVCASGSFTFTRSKSNSLKVIKCVLTCPSNMLFEGTYTCEIDFTLPALPTFTLTYKVDGETYEVQNCYLGIETSITNHTPDAPESYSFRNWQDLDRLKEYYPGDKITLTENKIVYANWKLENPPTCDTPELTLSGNNFTHLATYSTTLTNIEQYPGRTNPSATLMIGDEYDTETLTEGVTLSVPVTKAGKHDVKLYLTDWSGIDVSENVIDMGTIEVPEAKWRCSFTVEDVNNLPPDLLPTKKANMIVKCYNYTTSSYDTYGEYVDIVQTDDDWSFTLDFDYDHISNVDDCDVTVKLTYNHTETAETNDRKAFYTTTRNQNYSNGIYSVMFVGGCNPDDAPNHTSRTWWSYINNPLYFPDTNFAEVGSNDTGIMGLTKIGEYLGVIKQSKTTDTAIYLLYPTSFDEDTTFAQKQGVQGVGAIAKYSFNILGDETLFLSPQGVMAITPTEDDEHKVQNRSFYVDGKLLKETGIESAYSFVYDGMYWLSIGSHCYVLDGNQKNSYGNDRTNLVYEAYYLENLPANCFMKMGSELWFSNEECICKMKTEDSLDPYVDAYDDEGNEDVPVKAEWSTILDDDGALNYEKTMQKKGNVVSIFPCGHASVDVYIKQDDKAPQNVGTITSEDDIPKEFYVNKKIKKYGRVQFILKSESADGFGVDQIVKNYTLGNYRKR